MQWRKMIYYNKLVRDKIPEIIQSEGKTCNTRSLDSEELVQELRNKLIEEVEEYLHDPSKDELADILEVVEGLALTHDLSFDDILQAKEIKRQSRGSFANGIYLECVYKN